MNFKTSLSLRDRELLIKVLGDLVKANTTNPPGNEFRVARIVENFLQQIQVEFRKYEKEKGRTNILWSLGSGRPEILIVAHSDVVPAGNGWKTDPFELVRKNGQLIGRGVVDNKGPLAGILLATKLLKPLEKRLKNRITFLAVADEERGNQFGINYLFQQKILAPDLAIVPDVCGNNRLIAIAEKGTLHLRVRAFGKQGHGSMPEKSKNAIYIMKDFLAHLRRWKFSRSTKLLTHATISVGSFHAGSAPNIIPGEAEATLDIRYPPNESKAKILQKLKALALAESGRYKVRPIQLEVLSDLPPSETEPTHTLVGVLAAAIKKVTGRQPRVVGIPAFTVAGTLRSRGIPTVAFGPGDLAECHTANEHIHEGKLWEFVEVLLGFLVRDSSGYLMTND